MFGFSLLVVALLALWVLLSIQTLKPTESALMEYFGKLDEEILYGPGGICFVPWFFGLIKLITFSTEKYLPAYRGQSGFEARVKERFLDNEGKPLKDEERLQPIKVMVDANATFELAWGDTKSLARLVRSKVPIDDPDKLREWVRTAIALDITDLVGRYDYDQVKGAQKSVELTNELRKIITRPDHVLYRSGFFGQDPNLIEEGSGSFEFKVEFVHLPKNVSGQIDEAETERIRLQQAKIAQQRESVENVGPLMLMLIKLGFGKTEEEVQARIASNPKLEEMYAELCAKFTLNDQVMTGGGILKKYEGLDGMGDLTRGLLAAASELNGGGGVGAVLGGGRSAGGGSGSTSAPRKGDSGGKKPEKFTGDEQGEGESDKDYLDRMSE